MNQLSLPDSVTGDYARLALHADAGQLRHDIVLAEALRGALLIDLARHGNLTRTSDGTQVDSTPTGMPLADAVIREVNDHPTRTMQRWLQRGVPHLGDVVGQLVAEGCWTIEHHAVIATHAHYRDRDATRYQQMQATMTAITHGSREPHDEREAAMAALARVTGLAGAPAESVVDLDRLLTACGALQWIVTDVTTFLRDVQMQDLAAATADAGTTILQTGLV